MCLFYTSHCPLSLSKDPTPIRSGELLINLADSYTSAVVAEAVPFASSFGSVMAGFSMMARGLFLLLTIESASCMPRGYVRHFFGFLTFLFQVGS